MHKALHAVHRMLIPAALLLGGGGCATAGRIVEDAASGPSCRESLVYAGTRYHLTEIPLYRTRSRHHWASEIAFMLRGWHYIDLPLSFCADTILLPYTVPRTLYTKWKGKPTRAEIAVRPTYMEYINCHSNLRLLEADKVIYAQLHCLEPTEDPPQDIEFYREEMKKFNKGPCYVCPGGGEYRVGAQGEEPSCSVHGTLSSAAHVIEYIYRYKRLPPDDL